MKLKRKPEKSDILNIILLLIFIALLLWITLKYRQAFGGLRMDDLASSTESLREYILSYGGAGVWLMILLHALQVIVSVIPAMIVQFIGAAIYGLGVGMLIGIAGVAAGTAVSFYASRYLGRRVITLFVSEKQLNRLDNMMSANASAAALLVLFIIPFPKDILGYFIGLTKMRALKFFIISAMGRLPGMLVASYLGAHVLDRNYALVITAAVLTTAAMIVLYLLRGKILRLILKK